MKSMNATRRRKALEDKMASVFKDEAKSLSEEYRKIMFNDLVSAFENRLFVLNRVQSHTEFLTLIEGDIQFETQQA